MIYVIDILCTFILCAIFTRYLFKRKIEIKDRYHQEDWMFVLTFAMVTFIFTFIGEFIFVNLLKYYFHRDGKLSFLIMGLLDNGVLVPFICLLLSKIFKWRVKKHELNYTSYYSHNVTKVIFSVIIIVMCIKLLWIELNNYDIETIDASVNRIIIWISTVIGTWIGFENDSFKETKLDNIEKYSKKVIKFWKPIILFLLLFSIIILFTDKIFKNEIAFICIIISYFIIIITLVLDYLIMFYYKYPNEKISEKRFHRLVEEYKGSSDKSRKERFGHMQYWFDNGQIFIERVKVKYEGHENDAEFRRLFYRRRKKIKDFGSVLEFLKERNEEQISYIKAEKEKCKQKRLKNLEVQ